MIQRPMNRRSPRTMSRAVSPAQPELAMNRQVPEDTGQEGEVLQEPVQPMQPVYRSYQAGADHLLQPGEAVQWSLPGQGWQQTVAGQTEQEMVLLNMTFTVETDGQFALSLINGEETVYGGRYQLQAYQPATVMFNSRVALAANGTLALRNDSAQPVIIQQATLNILDIEQI